MGESIVMMRGVNISWIGQTTSMNGADRINEEKRIDWRRIEAP